MAPRPVVRRQSIPDWWSWAMREHGLSSDALAVLLTLCEYGDEEWICAQSERSIAQNVGLARATVGKAIARLIEIQAIVDLGREGKRSPRRLRVSASQPPSAAQLRLLATPASRRATQAGNGWLVSVD